MLGTTLGIAVSPEWEGSDVTGTLVGIPDGKLVGELLGDRLGNTLGTHDGLKLGDTLGDALGSLDG